MSEKEEQEFAVPQNSTESEAADTEKQDEGTISKRGSNDTKVGLTLRILVAAYVLYLAYGLVEGFGETTGSERIFIGAAIVIFLAAGGAILILSAKKLIRKEYRDADESAEGTEDEKER